MAGTATRTCVRCHSKKVRCSGHPRCQGCTSAGTQCMLYQRQKKSEAVEAVKYFKRRTEWLEEQLYQHTGIQCKSVATGTILEPVSNRSSMTTANNITQPLANTDTLASLSSLPAQEPSENSIPSNDVPAISLVTLNATGEMRYLGPSSGIFFASYATTLARSTQSGQEPFNIGNKPPNTSSNASNKENEYQMLSLEDSQILAKSFYIWIAPLYPIFDHCLLENLVAKCTSLQSAENISHSQNSNHTMEMATFYLVMALGAINHDNTIKELEIQAHESPFQHRTASGHSSALLYLKALKHIDLGAQCCTPSISFIRILLLISIYSSYEPISSSQWQLIGLAMRMAIELGLHTPSKVSRLPESEKEQRKSIFWTIYAMEINLAYNLGRPPSLGEEHITTDLPVASSAACFSTHHIRHRQIQGRIISQVYAANKSARNTMEADIVIARLQEELDEWKLSIPNPTQVKNVTSYPYDFWIRLYHGTTFVLHRSSPLRPDPPPESLERCLRSASAYIDNIYALLRSSNIPISWMLVQGVLFAGLTMLTTARMGFRQLSSHMGAHCLIVDLPAWIRRCSICLAIINERWNEDLLSRLDSQFEVIANDTLRIISSSLLSPKVSDTPDVTPLYCQSIANPASTPANCSPPNILAEDNLADGGDHFDLMLDMMGLDPMETFWDFSSLG